MNMISNKHRFAKWNLYMRFLQTLLLVFLIGNISCVQTEDLNTDIESNGCFSKSSLETVPWVKNQLKEFQQPKSGPLRVVIYSYKNEQFLVFENPTISSPMSYIFNCSGIVLPNLRIGYNEFYDQRKEVAILLEGKY